MLKLNAKKLREKLEPHISINSRLSTLRDIVREFCLEEGIPI